MTPHLTCSPYNVVVLFEDVYLIANSFSGSIVAFDKAHLNQLTCIDCNCMFSDD